MSLRHRRFFITHPADLARRYLAPVKWRGQTAAVVGGVAFLLVRGVLLWLVVPVGFVWWLVAWPWFRSRRVRLGQVLGWLDLNLIAAISHTAFRPLLRQPARYWTTDEMATVTHRILGTDPA